MLMVGNGKAEITERHHVDNLEYLTIRTTAGDVFEILTPQVSDGKLQQLRALACEILRQDREGKEDNAASRCRRSDKARGNQAARLVFPAIRGIIGFARP